MSNISARWHGLRATYDSNETSLRREVMKLVDYIVLFIAVLALASALARHRVAYSHATPPGASAASSSGYVGWL